MSRAFCYQCKRPTIACFCADIRPVYHNTSVVIIQDRGEKKHPFNTAKIAEQALAKCCVVDVEFESAQSKIKSLCQSKDAVLLFPEIDLTGAGLSIQQADTLNGDTELISEMDTELVLVVIDATWRKAKRIFIENTWLHSLTRLSINSGISSNYQIRQSSMDCSLSTIESIAEALEILEGDKTSGFSKTDLLFPFEKMVEKQVKMERRNSFPKD